MRLPEWIEPPLGRTNQSAGVPQSWAYLINSIMSASRSATYTRRVAGISAGAILRRNVCPTVWRHVRQGWLRRSHWPAQFACAGCLEVSPQAESKALKAGRLFALEGSGGRPLYPAFYSDGKVSRRVLETVTPALGDIPASSKWQFFTTPKASLGGATPLLALQRGDLQAVMATAAGFVER
jgi:hypothetical protein